MASTTTVHYDCWLYDSQRKKNPDLRVPGDPDYDGPLRQYITVFGSVNQLVIELDSETVPESVYAEATHNQGLLPLIVPGRSVIQVLKQLEFE